MTQLLAKLAGGELVGFVLVLARVTPLFVVAPLFSSSVIAPRVRGIIAVALSLGLTPVALHGQHLPADVVQLAGLVLEGLLVGFAFAFALAVLLAAIESAGALVDVIAGFSYGSLINPLSGQQGAVMARFYSLFGTMVFLVIGGVDWTLRGLGRTFKLVPVTGSPRLGPLASGAVHTFGTVFASALEVAAPVLIALLITDVAFGVVSRVVPQMNVFAVGFPTKVAVAMVAVTATLPFLADWVSNQLSGSVAAALGALQVG